MSSSQVLDKVIEAVAEHFRLKKAEVSPDTDIIYDLGGDSLASVEIPMVLEEEYDIDISVDEFHTATRVDALAQLVQRKLDEKG